VPSKYPALFTIRHGVTSQKRLIFNNSKSRKSFYTSFYFFVYFKPLYGPSNYKISTDDKAITNSHIRCEKKLTSGYRRVLANCPFLQP